MICYATHGEDADTTIIAEDFRSGITAQGGIASIERLADNESLNPIAEDCLDSDAVIVIFPVRGGIIPGVVDDFAKRVEDAKREYPTGRITRLGCIVTFDGGMHDQLQVESKCENIASRVDALFIGTVFCRISDRAARLARLPRRVNVAVHNLGRHFAVTREFHPLIARDLSSRSLFSTALRFARRR